MLGRTLKMAFWVTYDHIGKLILANLLWFLAVAVPASLGWTAVIAGDPFIRTVVGIPLLVLAFGIVLPVMTAGLAHMAAVLIERKDGSLGDFFRGIKLYGARATGLGLLGLFAAVSLLTSAGFYPSRLAGRLAWLGYGISAVALWALIFLGLVALLAMPALVQKKGGVFSTLKLSALLVLANPFFCLGLAVQWVAWTLVSLVVAPVMPLLYGSLAVVLVSSAYELLARKYAAVADGAVDPTGPRPAPLKDEEDDYLNRGVRDFFFPWKG